MSVGFIAFADEIDHRYAINLYATSPIEASELDTNYTNGEQFTALKTAQEEHILDVPFYKQKEDWYCGPATALQTYDYFYYEEYGEISPMTQEQMKTNIKTSPSTGTDVDTMLNYLNSCEFGCNYKQMWVWNDSVTYYTNQVCKVIDAGVPVIAWVKSPYSTSPLGYTTSGHILNISGYNEYGAQLEVTDPFYQWHNPQTTGKHFISNSALENITYTISYYF